MNLVILSGNLCKDIELKKIQSGASVISNDVAVKREFKEADGTYGVDYITFIVWDKKAEYLSKYAKKGDRVELQGRWQTRKYTDKNGYDRIVNEVVVEKIQVFSKPQQQSQEQSRDVDTSNISTYDDLPF